ncbi:MAG: tetratricopeptide repeat protein, partial [Alphaproteobacteria bacterium]
ANRSDPIAPSPSGRRSLAASIMVLAPAMAIGFYAWRGSPDIPGQPYVERGIERAAANTQRDNTMSLDAAATKLAGQLKENPENADGWMLLARTYMNIQRYGDAADAFGHALGLKSGDADLRSAYGEALTFAADGAVTPAARTVFEETLKQSPEDARSRFYLALAYFQGGDKQKGLDQWAALMRDSTADAPWVPAVRQRIAEAAKALNLDVAAVTPTPLPAQSGGPVSAPAPGPTAEQMQAAQNMTPEERQEMIRNMVAQLATKLEANPGDFDGWIRLIRSYATLDDKAAARTALDQALAHFKNAPFPKQKLTQLGADLKLTEAGSSSGLSAPNPSSEQIKDAQAMSAEDRSAMIGSMVARLAERLESEPHDIEGWTRLAQSYNVLGKPEKARDALAKAVKGAPDNTDLLVLYARAARAANGDEDTPESLEALRKTLSLQPENIEALWFVGGADAKAGNTNSARELWGRGVKALPKTSPDRAAFEKRLKSLTSPAK